MEGLSGAFELGKGAMGSMSGDLAEAAQQYEDARAGAEKLAGAIPVIGGAVQALLPLTFDIGEKLFGSLPETLKQIEEFENQNKERAEAAGKTKGDFEDNRDKLEQMGKEVTEHVAVGKMSPADRAQALINQEEDRKKTQADELFAKARHQLIKDTQDQENPLAKPMDEIDKEINKTPEKTRTKSGKWVENGDYTDLIKKKNELEQQYQHLNQQRVDSENALKGAHGTAAAAIEQERRQRLSGVAQPSQAAYTMGSSASGTAHGGGLSSSALERTADVVGKIYAILEKLPSELADLLKHPSPPVVS